MRQSIPSDRIFEAAPRLADGRGLFDRDSEPVRLGLEAYRVPDDAMRQARGVLEAVGLDVVAANAFTLTVVAPEQWGPPSGSLLDAETGVLTLADAPSIAGLAVTSKTLLHTDPLPPPTPYFCLRAPVDMLTALNGTRAAFAGHTGAGVHIAIVDSGCDTSHPFFTERRAHIRLLLGPGTQGPNVDTLGHGTMICGTILSIAPEAHLSMIKTADDLSLAAFKYAASLVPRPQIIQNTWGHITQSPVITPYEKAVYAAITSAVADGSIVVFAAGNQKIIFPPQVPAAIASGGAYVDATNLCRASDYASGYDSVLFPGRGVPDICGLVGPAPGGIYIMLPTSPGSIIDVAFAAYPYPRGDGGQPDDGWVVISGTSSASAQTTATIALLLQVRPDLTVDEVKRILAATACRVDVGTSAQGGRSGPPYPNPATGWGLIDIEAALASL